MSFFSKNNKVPVKKSGDAPAARDDFFNAFDNFFNNWDTLDFPKWDETLMPKLNVSEEGDSYEIEAELPGVEKDQIQVELKNNRLVIKGEKKGFNEDKKDKYHRIERSHGSFFRSMILPDDVDQDKVSAKLTDGVLHVSVGKTDAQGARKVDISS